MEAFDNFEKVYQSLFEATPNPSEEEEWLFDGMLLEETDTEEPEVELNPFDARMKLMDFYDLSEDELRVITYLMHYRETQITRDKLFEIIAARRVLRKDSAKLALLSDLEERGFIKMGKTVCDIPCYRITEEARHAFMTESEFGPRLFEDCMGELKKMHPVTNKWLRCWYLTVKKKGDSRLREGIEEIGIQSQPEEVQKLFWQIVGHFVQHFIRPMDRDEEAEPAELKTLVSIGYLESYSEDNSLNENASNAADLFLSPLIANKLFYGHDELIDYRELAKLIEIHKSSDIKKCHLFYPEDTQEEMEHLRAMVSQEGFKRARNILLSKQRRPGILSLLWGPPGTGKTEICKQLARESGRDLLIFDSSKTTASAWGATERLYRSLFRAYRYIAAIAVSVPILLINEADAILSKRLTDLSRTIDKSENAITNILLQEFEDFEGILLATTNLVDNLDPAFDRRFLFKTEVGDPDLEARKQIWIDKIPELSKEAALKLAEEFAMSGGQISNVVAKRDLAELYYDGDRGLPFLIDLCKKELSVSHRNMPVTKIGF